MVHFKNKNMTRGEVVCGLNRFAIGLLVAICLSGFAGCKKEPRTRSGKVIGGSMAPNFLGEHLCFDCLECSSTVVADKAQSEKRFKLVCPFCGALTALEDCKTKPAEPLEIQLENTNIARWNVVAFQSAELDGAGIKRVVGLPGESVEIRNGNLFVEGRLLRKPIETQKQMRLLVHDSNFTNPNSASWVDSSKAKKDHPSGSNAESSAFSLANNKIVFEANENQSDFKWIAFCPQPNYSRGGSSVERSDSEIPFLVEDFYGYNQSVTRNLNSTDEIFVSMSVQAKPTSKFGFEFNSRRNQYRFELDGETKTLTINIVSLGLLSKDGESKNGLGKRVFDLAENPFSDSGSDIEFSSIDKRLILLINGNEVFRHDCEVDPEHSNSNVEESHPVFQIGASMGIVEISNIKIWRDLFYLAADGKPGGTQILSGDLDGFLLLGDNAPISIDSRQWVEPAVERTKIFGKLK